MNHRVTLVASLLSVGLLTACSSPDDSSPGGLVDGPGSSRKLRTLEDGEAFLAVLRAGLIAQASTNGGYPETDGMAVESPEAPRPGGVPPSDSDNSAAGGSGESDDDSAGEITSTNVQEQGVDEQDWVKLSGDGSRLYVLNSVNPYYGGPAVGMPVNDVEPGDGELPSGTSMPAPEAMNTTLRIMQLDKDAPDASSLRDLEIPLDGRFAEGFYLYESSGKTQAVLTSTGNNYWAYWSDSPAFGGVDSLITRVDVTAPSTASVTGSLIIDGQIVSSRRIGKYLFFASRFYPSIPVEQPGNQTPEAWTDAVNNADVADLLPQYKVNGSDNRTALIDPAGCFVTDAARSNDYYSPDIITLAVVDLDTLQISDSECYLGASETLYASPEAVFLATTQYDYSVGPVTEGGQVIDVSSGQFPADLMWNDPRVDTDIHQFDIDAGNLVYAGSGTVKGHLGWNQLRKPFRMSEKNGFLRVATFNDRQGLDRSPILMTVLKADGKGDLETVSTLPNPSQPAFIGKPGEQLYASRFVGDRAYLVTFRQIDPLYVINLADPAKPALAGELQINGYSDYLHPIDEDFLLGIGRDADVSTGSVLGIKLSLFNVSNPASPQKVQSVLVGQRGTASRALYDHRAITVQRATGQHPTRVSFGIDVYGQAMPSSSASGSDAFRYYNWNYTGLHGFDISTGADAGITSRGAMVVASAGNNNGYDYPGNADDRSVMVNDSLFYIRGDKVYAAPWDDLANPTPAR